MFEFEASQAMQTPMIRDPGMGAFHHAARSDPAAGRKHDLWQEDVLAQMLARHMGKRILVADSNPGDRVRLAELLAAARLDVNFAVDGAEAVTQASDLQADLILMSARMPVMDGLTASRVLRALPFARQVPIIALSDGVLDDEYARFLVAGMDDFIAKPFVAKALHRCVLRWLDRRVMLFPQVAPPALSACPG